MPNPPAISVITPTYKATAYIAQALDSLLVQTFQDFECIVVNDGCPDTAALERVLEPYQSRIRYIRQENKGVSGAANTAIRAAQGQFILTLHPDDWLEPDCLESQYAIIRSQPDLDAVYCNSTLFGDTPWANTCWMDHYPSEGPVSFLSVIESRTCPANPGSIVRRETLLRVGLYDETLRSWEDYDLWLRILKADPPGKMAFNTKPLVHYRQHGGNLTGNPRVMEYAVRVLDKAAASFALDNKERAALERRRKEVAYDVAIRRGKESVRSGDWKTARQQFEYCLADNRGFKLRVVYFCLKWCPWLLTAAIYLRGVSRMR